MAIRYIRQRDNFRCAPIAILNALKWAGAPVTYRDLQRIAIQAHCTKILGGTSKEKLSKTLRALGADYFTTHEDKYPKIKDMETWLKNDGAVVVSCMSRQETGYRTHTTLVTSVSSNRATFTVVNYFPEKTPALTVGVIQRAIFLDDLRRRKTLQLNFWYPIAWYLKRKKKRKSV